MSKPSHDMHVQSNSVYSSFLINRPHHAMSMRSLLEAVATTPALQALITQQSLYNHILFEQPHMLASGSAPAPHMRTHAHFMPLSK